MSSYLSLKNGTDVRGTALAVGNAPVDLTTEAVYCIAKAFCRLVKARGIPSPMIALGHDPRLSSQDIVRMAALGIHSESGKVLYTGLSSTPSMFMLLKDGTGADASVMVTASHLPKEKNGLKFFLPEGGLESEELTALLELAGEFSLPAADASAPLRFEKYCDHLVPYAKGLVEMVRRGTGEERPLAGKRILVDAGGGSGGFYERLVLKPLGADTAGSQFLEPDGNFPNHIPNPENTEAMRSVCEAVKRHHADFGIIFDTDVDRAGAVSSSGEEINRNRLIALISAILLEETPGATIVTDSVTSDGLTQFIHAHGGVHRRFKRGYKNVINESKRLNAVGINSPLAIETSGHAAFQENYFLDDGAYLVTRLLIALAKAAKSGKDLLSLIADLPEPAETREVRLKFAEGTDFKTLGNKVLQELEAAVQMRPHLTLAPDNCEGVRINFDKDHGDGWVLVRMSLHEPIMPVNAESNSEGGVAKILATLHEMMNGYAFLDIDNLLGALTPNALFPHQI